MPCSFVILLLGLARASFKNPEVYKEYYRAVQRFGQAKLSYGGLVLILSQYLLLPQLPQKMMVSLKVVKFDL